MKYPIIANPTVDRIRQIAKKHLYKETDSGVNELDNAAVFVAKLSASLLPTDSRVLLRYALEEPGVLEEPMSWDKGFSWETPMEIIADVIHEEIKSMVWAEYRQLVLD